MGTFFIDDSVHERAGFILCSVVYASRGVSSRVSAALRGAGLRPGQDEFKSGDRMQGRPTLSSLRDELLGIIQASCRVGLVVAPRSERPAFGAIVLDGLAWMLRANGLARRPGEIFVDEGMFRSSAAAVREAAARPALAGKVLHPEQDSRAVLGIQLADLAAHTCATMLLERLGHVTKTVKAGENSGYDPEWDLELGFALWSRLRYAFFRRRDSSRSPEDPVYDASPGLYIAPSCPPALREAAESRFSTVYLGCIH